MESSETIICGENGGRNCYEEKNNQLSVFSGPDDRERERVGKGSNSNFFFGERGIKTAVCHSLEGHCSILIHTYLPTRKGVVWEVS